MTKIREWLDKAGEMPIPPSRICNCIGPQNGQPLCPCMMRGVRVKNGRYVMPERDLGPAPSDKAGASQ